MWESKVPQTVAPSAESASDPSPGQVRVSERSPGVARPQGPSPERAFSMSGAGDEDAPTGLKTNVAASPRAAFAQANLPWAMIKTPLWG